jgi:histone H3/H4
MIQDKLPDDVKMATQAKDLLINLSTMFVANLASKANTLCATHKKKTIVAEHVFEALYEQKQSHLLAQALNQTNYTKFSYVK